MAWQGLGFPFLPVFLSGHSSPSGHGQKCRGLHLSPLNQRLFEERAPNSSVVGKGMYCCFLQPHYLLWVLQVTYGEPQKSCSKVTDSCQHVCQCRPPPPLPPPPPPPPPPRLLSAPGKSLGGNTGYSVGRRQSQCSQAEGSLSAFVIFHWPSRREAKAQLSPAVCKAPFPLLAFPGSWRRKHLPCLIR